MLGLGLGLWQLGANRNLVSPSGVAAGLFLDTRSNTAFVSGAPSSLAAILNVVRATTAMDEYADGSVVSVGTNVARYGGGRGLLIERGATNSIRNSTNTGAVSGSPGTLPTNWTLSSVPTGLTRTITTSTINGYDVIDFNFVGTASSTATIQIQWEGASQVAAAVGQVWTSTIGFSMPVDDAAITSVSLETWEYNAVPTFLATGSFLAMHSSRATFARRSYTGTVSQATTAFIRPTIRTNTINSGTAVNVTFRISAPQLETGPLATSFIPTTTVAVTRNADQVKITGTPLTAGIGAGTSFTWFAEYEANVSVSTSYLGGVINNGAPSFNNSIYSVLGVTRNVSAGIVSGGVGTFVNAAATANAPPTLNRLAMRVAANDAAISHNGAAVITDTSITLPAATMDCIVLGSAPHSIGAEAMNGRMTRFAAWPSLLSNADLQGIL